MAVAAAVIRHAYEAACRAEIAALKPGNVHVFADGHRMTAAAFLASAAASAAALAAPGASVGARIRAAVEATRAAVGTNTNLGIVLLCAPLAAAAERDGPLRGSLAAVLSELTQADADDAFAAIRLAEPGGLGTSARHDVHRPAAVSLGAAMREAAARDSIARQYVTVFKDVFDIGLPALHAARRAAAGGMWPAVEAYLAFLAAFPDSHVARKHGLATALQVRAEAVTLRRRLAGCPDRAAKVELLAALDVDLKARGLNPGTSADLTVACLLVDNLMAELAS